MKIMSSTSDGFKISEEDLKMRGPGDFFGSAQHGLPPLKIADIACNMELMNRAQTCAKELLARVPEYDYLLAPEAKAIPLIYEMARQSGKNKYFVARKHAKAYMTGIFEVNVRSITTDAEQKLIIDSEDAALIRGKRILLVDDVISTGESILAVQKLVEAAGGIVVGRAAPLAEGDAYYRDDIITLAQLPLFNADGSIK